MPARWAGSGRPGLAAMLGASRKLKGSAASMADPALIGKVQGDAGED